MTQLDLFPETQVAVQRKLSTEMVCEWMRTLPQIEAPVIHNFAPGVYVRQITMPAGSIVIGKIHRTEHLNIVEKGSCRLYDGRGGYEDLVAPCKFVSKPGVQKILYMFEDVVWSTVHPTNETDLDLLDAEMIEPAPVLPDHIKEQIKWLGLQ